MTTYAIGDVQGCYSELQQLLERIKFDPAADVLWFAGDLVNRGPASLKTLRLVKSLGKSAITVLGNHDIHLLALHYGLRDRGRDPTLDHVLNARDVDDLIHWLQQLPVMHVGNEYILVHAGIHPMWSRQTAIELANDLHRKLSVIGNKSDLAPLYGSSSGTWQDAEQSPQRERYALNCFTRMRFCDNQGVLDFSQSGSPGTQPEHLLPWFEVADRPLHQHSIVFGHWAALGLYNKPPIHGLDSGCVWGNSLTALRLDDLKTFSVPCSANR